MFGAQSRENVRHMKWQIQSLRKLEMPAAEYMDKVKALDDAMAAPGAPLSDDDIIDFMLTGLGLKFNPLAASMIRNNDAVTLAEFFIPMFSSMNPCVRSNLRT
jgi:hypothetical protein